MSPDCDRLARNLVQKTGAVGMREASHTIRRTLAGAGLNARAVSSQGGLVPGGGEPLHDLAGEGAVVALGPAWTHTLLEHVVVGVLLDVRDQVGLVGARPR